MAVNIVTGDKVERIAKALENMVPTENEVEQIRQVSTEASTKADQAITAAAAATSAASGATTDINALKTRVSTLETTVGTIDSSITAATNAQIDALFS